MYAFSDLTSNNGTQRPNVKPPPVDENITFGPTVYSLSHVFDQSDYSQTIQIMGGPNWIAGNYLIDQVTADGGAVLSRPCGTVDALSGGIYAVGVPVNPNEPVSACNNPVPDGWGAHGPNQAVDCANAQEGLTRKAFRKHTFSGRSSRYGNVAPIN